MIRKISSITFVLLLVLSASVFAGYGNGAMDGTGPMSAITNGEPVTISGVVASIGSGSGMVLDTGDGMVTIYGIGPVWFWQNSGVARPQVGEDVVVDGYKVTFSDGTERIIASKITLSGTTVELRDQETGAPLWRKAGANSARRNCRFLR